MDQQLATLTRALTAAPSRRHLLRGLAAAGLGLASAQLPDAAVARRKRKKARLNSFGCVNVGNPCHGDDRLCCSGICEGAKPKHGTRDRSRCAAHDASACRGAEPPGEICEGASVACTTSTGDTAGDCYVTTGNGPYCGAEFTCRPCQNDTDCQPFCGEAAACVKCPGCPQGDTACASPSLDLCQFPGV